MRQTHLQPTERTLQKPIKILRAPGLRSRYNVGIVYVFVTLRERYYGQLGRLSQSTNIDDADFVHM